MVNIQEEKPSRTLHSALKSGDYSDCTVICAGPKSGKKSGKSWRCHRVILASQSDSFAATFEEHPEADEVLIKDQSPEDVEKMLNSMYHVNSAPSNETEKWSFLEVDKYLDRIVRDFGIACRFGVPSLKNAATKSFQTEVGRMSDKELVNSHAQAIRAVYASTTPGDEPLKQIICAQVGQLLHGHSSAKDTVATNLKDLLENLDRFASDMAKALLLPKY